MGQLSSLTSKIVRGRARRDLYDRLYSLDWGKTTSSLEGYSGRPGTPNLERFRNGDRMYFLACLSPCPQEVVCVS